MNHIRIHYLQPDGAYTGWTIYAFGETTEDQGNYNGGPVQISGYDGFGVYFDVGITTGASSVGIIVHHGNTVFIPAGPFTPLMTPLQIPAMTTVAPSR